MDFNKPRQAGLGAYSGDCETEMTASGKKYWSTLNSPTKSRPCDFPGCGNSGEFRAPKAKDRLEEYYWFCLDHVREYNASWDYFAGMNEGEIEKHIRNATVWDRPSWPLGDWQKCAQSIRDAIDEDFFGGEARAEAFSSSSPSYNAGEREALAVLEITPPVDFAAIKAQYRVMVKKHHPDANGGDTESEEKFKIITQAFALLRGIYGSDETDEGK